MCWHTRSYYKALHPERETPDDMRVVSKDELDAAVPDSKYWTLTSTGKGVAWCRDFIDKDGKYQMNWMIAGELVDESISLLGSGSHTEGEIDDALDSVIARPEKKKFRWAMTSDERLMIKRLIWVGCYQIGKRYGTLIDGQEELNLEVAGDKDSRGNDLGGTMEKWEAPTTVRFGRVDVLAENDKHQVCLMDLKCSSQNTMVCGERAIEYRGQVLCYYLLGLATDYELYSRVNKLVLFTPYANEVLEFDTSLLAGMPETVARMCHVIGFSETMSIHVMVLAGIDAEVAIRLFDAMDAKESGTSGLSTSIAMEESDAMTEEEKRDALRGVDIYI